MQQLGEKKGLDALNLKDVGILAAIIFTVVGSLVAYQWNHRTGPDPLGLRQLDPTLEPLEIDVMADGSILINGRRTNETDLRQFLESAKEDRRRISVYTPEPKNEEAVRLSNLLSELKVGVIQIRFQPKAERDADGDSS